MEFDGTPFIFVAMVTAEPVAYLMIWIRIIKMLGGMYNIQKNIIFFTPSYTVGFGTAIGGQYTIVCDTHFSDKARI